MANESVETKRYFWYEVRQKLSAFCKKIKFDQWKGWIYLAPTMVLLMIFTVWPIFNTIRMSLLEGYNTMGEVGGQVFNFGIGNFTRVLDVNQHSSVQFSCSVVSDSLRPHESQHARPPCPSPTPGVHSNSRPSSQ